MQRKNGFKPQKLNVHELKEIIRDSDFFGVMINVKGNEIVELQKEGYFVTLGNQRFQAVHHNIGICPKTDLNSSYYALGKLTELIGQPSYITHGEMNLHFVARYDYVPEHEKWLEKIYLRYNGNWTRYSK